MRDTYGQNWPSLLVVLRSLVPVRQQEGTKGKSSILVEDKLSLANISEEDKIFLLLDAERGGDALKLAFASTWWEWAGGSGLLFWRWGNSLGLSLIHI